MQLGTQCGPKKYSNLLIESYKYWYFILWYNKDSITSSAHYLHSFQNGDKKYPTIIGSLHKNIQKLLRRVWSHNSSKYPPTLPNQCLFKSWRISKSSSCWVLLSWNVPTALNETAQSSQSLLVILLSWKRWFTFDSVPSILELRCPTIVDRL